MPKSSTSRDVLVKPTISETTIKKVELINNDGSNALVDLEIKFRKPDNINRIGGTEVSRILKISASLCPRFLHNTSCPPGQKLVDSGGDNKNPWFVCEDCRADLNGNNITSASPIMSCYALGFGSVPTILSTAPAGNQQNSALCELEKQVFFQSMTVGTKTISSCGKNFEIVPKKILYTDSSQRIQATIPSGPNIIKNSITLHLVGGGGGGGCEHHRSEWSSGGVNGEVKVIHLNHMVNGGELIYMWIGKGGTGHKNNMLGCASDLDKLAKPGLGTHVVFQAGFFKSEFLASGGAASDGVTLKNQNDVWGPPHISYNNAKLTLKSFGLGITFAGVDYSGGDRGWDRGRDGKPGQIGSGGGSSYMSNNGGNGGDGAVALTWLEWVEK